MPKYAFRDDIDLSPRKGDQLTKFGLDQMKVGQSFVIPYVERVIKGKKKNSPESGINIKEANRRYAPKRFTKRRTEQGLVVGRVADAEPASKEPAGA